MSIPITTMNEGGASNGDYSGVPASVAFASGETAKTFAFRATQDTEDDDEESVKLGFGNLPTGVSEGATRETVVSITDDDVPSVTVSFGQGSYSVAEGGTVTVRVTLSADPERSVNIPITTMNEGGAANGDYSGVPANVVFASGETEQTFTLRATQDTGDDDDESVKLGFGNLPTGVSEGATRETVVSITDDDVPSVTVSFGQGSYSVAEGGTVTVRVTLSADPERSVNIPITTMNEGGAANGDCSGVPANVVFASGETEQTFTLRATQDTGDDDDESVKLGFGNLPTGVTEGTTTGTVVSITDDDVPSVTVSFGQSSYSVAEGGTVTVRVTLSADPERSVTIPLTATGQDSVSPADYSGVPASVVFASGETEQTFTLRATQDEVDDDGESVIVSFEAPLPDGVSEGAPHQSTVSITDDDDAAIVLSDANLIVEEGDATGVSYSVKLASQPTANVTVTISGHSGTDLILSGTTLNASRQLTFTTANWNTAQTVTIQADQDEDAGDDENTLTHTASGGGYVNVTADLPVTITDDETASIVLVPASLVVEEGDATGSSYTVKLSHVPTGMVTVTISGHSGTDLSLSGTTLTTDQLTFTTANWNTVQTVTVRADQDDDPFNDVATLLHAASGGSRDSATETLGVTVSDDETASIVLSPDSLTVEEGDATGSSYTVKLSRVPTGMVTVTISGHSGTDLSLSGTTLTNDQLTFTTANWNTAQAVTVTAADDSAAADGSETLTHTATGGGYGSATDDLPVTITDDAPATVAVSFGSATYSVTEGSSVTVRVNLDADPERSVTVPITATNHGSSNSDYSGVPASVTFNSGDTSRTFTVFAVEDSLNESREKVQLGFGSQLGVASRGSPSETTVSMYDRTQGQNLPTPPTVHFGSATYNVAEGDSVAVSVKLSKAPGSDVEILITTTNQGATGADYSGVPASLTFGAADTEKTIVLLATDDAVDDDAESITLGFGTLPGAITATTGEADAAIVSITDNDVPSVTVSFGQGSYSVAEGGTVTVRVTLSADPERSVTIPLTATGQDSVSPADYSGVPASVVFASGETAKTFTFSATQDTANDDRESVKLTFGPLPTGVSEGATTETVVSITDDDVPAVTVSFAQSAYSVAEGGTVTVRVTLSADPERSVTIPITTMNEGGATSADYSGVPANVTFARGETAKTITFSATQDNANDDRESVKLTFGPLPTGVSEGATRETVVSITDDDVPAVMVSFGQGSYSVAEGGTVTVRVTLSADPERSVTIPLTATGQDSVSPADYSGVPASVVFASDETAKTFTFSATQDNANDDRESVKLTFGPLPTGVSEGATRETVVSITDDDVPAVTVGFGQEAYTVAEGGTQTVTVTLSADPERSVTIPITTLDEGGASNSDYSGVPASVTFARGDTAGHPHRRCGQQGVGDRQLGSASCPILDHPRAGDAAGVDGDR